MPACQAVIDCILLVIGKIALLAAVRFEDAVFKFEFKNCSERWLSDSESWDEECLGIQMAFRKDLFHNDA